MSFSGLPPMFSKKSVGVVQRKPASLTHSLTLSPIGALGIEKELKIEIVG